MKTTRKGGIILKILALLAFLLMVIAILIPKKMWEEQTKRTEIAHKRMLDMNECEIAYMQENGTYEKDLKKVYDYIATHTMGVGAPEMETEILAVDSTSFRASFSDIKHVKDITAIRTDNQELVRLPGLATRPYEHLFYCGSEIKIALIMKDEKLDLYSDYLLASSSDSIFANAIYKNEKEIIWEFSSKSKFTMTKYKAYSLQAGKNLEPVLNHFAGKKIEVKKSADGLNQVVFLSDGQMSEFSSYFDPAAFLQEAQNVSMSRYLLTDVDNDKEPYLCPSTLDNFKVNYNLSGKFYLKVKFFRGETEGYSKGEKLASNEQAKNYFINMVKLKAERKMNDFIREKEVEGDSSLSKPDKKNALFAKYFNEFIAIGLKEGAISDSISNTLTALDETQEQDFSEEKKLNILFNVAPGELALSEAAKPENAALINSVLFTMSQGTDKIDVTSLKISSPITESSTFRGYTRSFLQSKAFFGVADDKNHGFIDNGRASWKKE